MGTESAIDRAKSTKSFLMSFFEVDDHHSIEGLDTTNACYSGTNALLSTINWIQSCGWMGTFGIALCSDPAVHPDPAQLPGAGASSISILVAPVAGLVLE